MRILKVSLFIIFIINIQLTFSQTSATIKITDGSFTEISNFRPKAKKVFAEVKDWDGDVHLDYPDTIYVTYRSSIDTLGELGILIETGNYSAVFRGSIDLLEVKRENFNSSSQPDGILQVIRPEGIQVDYYDIGDFGIVRKIFAVANFGVFDGELSADELDWTSDNNPYYVGYVSVPLFERLRLFAGVEVRFLDGGGLSAMNLAGIDIYGTEIAPVVLTSYKSNPHPGAWNGIFLDNSWYASIIQNVRIEYASTALSGMLLTRTTCKNITISNCITGINLGVRFGLTIVNSKIENNTGDGIYCANSNIRLDDLLEIKNSFIRNNGGSGINLFVTMGRINIDSSEISGNGNYGIHVSRSWSGEIVLNRSNIYNNKVYDICNGMSSAIDARLNWWGEATTDTINMGGNPKNLSSIYDVYDNKECGFVNYANWKNNKIKIYENPNSDVTEKLNPYSYFLSQNYPNPFNPSTTINYALPTRSVVRLTIYNMLGQVVKELVNAEQQAGNQSAVWQANGASGIYFYRLEATSLENPSNRFVETKKMVLLR